MHPIRDCGNTSSHAPDVPMRFILLAGALGGVAEIAWVCLFSISSPLSGTTVARGVAAALWPALAASPTASAIGILIHMGLSFVIAFAFATTIWKPALRLVGRGGLIIASLFTLGLIWVFNFFILLPIISPEFVHLLPLPASLFSKFLFGLAMGLVLADPLVTSRIGFDGVMTDKAWTTPSGIIAARDEMFN